MGLPAGGLELSRAGRRRLNIADTLPEDDYRPDLDHETDLSNLTLLCPACHADCHTGLFTITMINNIPHITETWPGKPPP